MIYCKPLPDADDDWSDYDSSNQGNDAPPDRGVFPSHKSQEVANPPRSHIISKYFSHDGDQGRGWAALSMMMITDLGGRSYKKAPWIAHLMVKSNDIARLMREGFFWSAENIIPEEGFMSSETKPHWTKIGFRHKRTWILTDKSNEEDPTWVGYLEVITRSWKVLPRFRVQDLTRENVYAATAWNELGHLIYNHHDQRPRKSYNCIYDDKPLPGWWPWPKEDGGSTFSAVLGKGVCTKAYIDTHLEPQEPEDSSELHRQRSSICVIL